MPRLQMRYIVKRYGSVVANDGVDLSVEPGTIHALVGQNGAGKTTLMNILYGMISPDAGEIRLDDRSLHLRTPRDALAHGLGMVHQHFMLIPPFTGLENIILGREPRRWGFLDRRRAERRIRKLLESWGLDLELNVPVSELSIGARQRLEILRLLYQGAQIFILDEPTAVLAPPEVAGLFHILRRLREQGCSVIFISHKLDEVFAIADVISVMRAGKIVGTVEAAQTTREQIAAWMIGDQGKRKAKSGRRDGARQPESQTTEGPEGQRAGQPNVQMVEELDGWRAGLSGDRPPRLRVRAIRLRRHGVWRLDGVDLDVFPGEIFGIAGVEGNGQQELVDVLTGRERPDEGMIEVDGQPIRHPTPGRMRAAGLALIPADRQREGGVLDASLQENFLLGRERAFSRWGWLQWPRVAAELRAILREYDLEAPSPQMPLRALSGGSQQKLIVARELASQPRWIVAAHPTRGLDIQATQFVQSQLLAQRARGAAIVLLSSELEELLHLSDRIAVMYRGRFLRVFEAASTDVQELGRWMLGQPTEEEERRDA